MLRVLLRRTVVYFLQGMQLWQTRLGDNLDEGPLTERNPTPSILLQGYIVCFLQRTQMRQTRLGDNLGEGPLA